MRKLLTGIVSQREYNKTPSWTIVYEWEDILSDRLGLQVRSEHFFYRNYIVPILNKFHLYNLFNVLMPARTIHLAFDSISHPKSSVRLNKNCIPVIIDFWLNKKELPHFYKAYRYVPLILVTNKEVYDLLKDNGCPIPVEHWALSYPDYYALEGDSNYEKKYDVCLFGRNNPFFIRMLDEYCNRHSGFHYIYNRGISSDRDYLTNDGKLVCHDTGRECYLSMIKATRVSCYSTPGIDESKRESNGFNQVTPRVFEMLCGGCHIIGHYPISSDVRWYKLESVVPNIHTYDEFEACLNEMLQTPFDIKKVKAFMGNHYTSVRAQELRQILRKYNIEI